MDSMQNNAAEMAQYAVGVDIVLENPHQSGTVWRPRGTKPEDIRLTEDEKDWFAGDASVDVRLSSVTLKE